MFKWLMQIWAGVNSSAIFYNRQNNILKVFKRTQDDLKQLVAEQKEYDITLTGQINDLVKEQEIVFNQISKSNEIIEKLNDFVI